MAKQTEFVLAEAGLPALSKRLEVLQEDLENTLTGLARDDEASYDPMTGQPFTRLPDKVRIIARRDSFCSTHERPQEDRTVSETDPGNQVKQQTATGHPWLYWKQPRYTRQRREQPKETGQCWRRSP
ncbi:MAG: hypothetical protein OXI80_07830 [Caldilineaceae bacterium]|nr:hypothetical protein [Caldilineaceae bacterium]